jgi:hypothetical protein
MVQETPPPSLSALARFGLGGPGSLPTQGSHGPVRARIRAYGSSDHGFAACVITHPKLEKLDCFASAAIRSCFVDTFVEFRSIRRVSQERFLDPTPRFPPLAPGGTRSPASRVLSRRYDFLPPIPPRFVAFAWRYLSVHSFTSLPGGRVRRRSLELVTRCLRPGLR